MQQSRQLYIYPNARSIRAALEKELNQNQILPKFVTIGEFEKKIVRVKNRIFIDEDTRVIVLKEASDFEKFKELKIEREFLSFLKNSSFILSFFDELSIEKVSFEELESADYYALYQEHIAILKQLHSNYTKLLDSYGYCDKVNLISNYQLNSSYIKSYDLILLHLEGYLSNFEMELFEKVASMTELQIEFKSNKFNQKMIDKFKKMGLKLECGYRYKISLSKQKIIYKKRIEAPTTKFHTFSSNSRVLQVAFVKKSIYDFIKNGIDPSNIAVIVPDASFVKYLMLFNDENIFNFAMGLPFVDSYIYKRLEALYLFLSEQNLQNFYRLKRLGFEFESGFELLNEFKGFDSFEEFESKILKIANLQDDEYSKLFLKELYLFQKLYNSLKGREFREILHLLLERVKKSAIDDVRGGKVTVLEPLESRGVEFEGVIVVDFNDSIVPNRSSKDLFLSSDLRKLCSMPTIQDRQNLQKYLYSSLFERAKYVNISYVEDEQSMPSRFLDELGIEYSNSDDSYIENLHTILFENHPQKEHFLKEYLILEYDFTKVKLSASRLKTFLECKRRYYYRYIANLDEVSLPREKRDQRDIGIMLHSILNSFYKKKDHISDADELLLYLQKKLYQEIKDDISFKFQVDLWLERLKEFAKSEVLHFQEGFRVLDTEVDMSRNFGEFKIAGKIDRIDIKDGKINVIDYKSGNINFGTAKSLEKWTDFQLQFYYLLSSQRGDVENCYYYDLKEAKLFSDPLFSQKLELLKMKLELLKPKTHNFTLCEDIKNCTFCPYKMLCDRDG